MNRIAIVAVAVALAMLVGGCGGGFPKESGTTKVAMDSADDHGYQGRIAITFDGGKIKGVVYDEVNKAGRSKGSDAAYAKQMEPASGTTPAKAVKELVSRLIAAQDPGQVQAVTGATQTSDRFKKLAAQAVAKK
jgi:major membrane immunogen (membrane-anchored lipoprotein)